MKNNRSLYLFTICFLILTAPSLASGWFEFNNDSTTYLCSHDKKSGDPSTLYLYDNFSACVNENNQPYLISSYDGLVPADSIDINIPLQNFNRDNLEGKFSLDALLNANIELQMLMEEYKKLQQRTAALLKTLDIPYLKKLNESINEKPGVTIVPKGKLMESSGESNARVETQELKKRISETSNNIPSGYFYTSDREIPSFSGLKFEKKAGNNGGDNVFTFVDGKSESSSDGKLIRPVNRSPLYTGSSQNSTSMEVKDPAADDVNLSGGHTDRDLPWIFRLILGTLSYIAQNKTESLFYCLLFFSVFYLIYLKIKNS